MNEEQLVTKELNKLLESMSEEQINYISGYLNFYTKEFTDARQRQEGTPAEFMQAVNELMDKEIEDHKSYKGTSCKKGCAHCCHISVSMFTAEAELILKYCALNDINIDWDTLEAQKGLDVIERALHPKSACVFLNSSNECGIYPVRPMACRKYFVVTPPADCDASTNTKTVSIKVDWRAEALVASVAAQEFEDGHMSDIMLKVLIDGASQET